MKCMPITASGREVAAAILVMEMEEVLVARITPGCAISSKSRKSCSLRSTFSVAASEYRTAGAPPYAPHQREKGMDAAYGTV
jgi:hypothetical protein